MQNQRRAEDDRLIALKKVKDLVAAEIVPQIEKDFSFRGYFSELFQSDKEMFSRIIKAIEIQNNCASVLQSNFAPVEIGFFKTFIRFRERDLDERKRRYGSFAPYLVPFLLLTVIFLFKSMDVAAIISIPLFIAFFIIAFTSYFYGLYLLHKAKYVNLEIKGICETALDTNRQAD